jgi:uncharacterized protein YcbK (DUF882 family)
MKLLQLNQPKKVAKQSSEMPNMLHSQKLTKNFSLNEFKCRDGSSVPDELIENVQLLCENLQVLRDHIDKPVRIISGYRSPKYNQRIGGAKKSQHMVAKAADIKITGMSPSEVKNVILNLIKDGKMMKGGVGLYKTFTHYDVRGRNARWHGKGAKDDKA